MRSQIVQTKAFEKEVTSLIAKGKLRLSDFDEFKKNLSEHPLQGDVIPGTGGIEKLV